jgi:hypothetical protein
LRDAYRGRVWRSLPGLVGRELLLVGLAALLVGALRHLALVRTGGAALAGFGAALALLGDALVNLRRVRMLRAAPACAARIGRPRRVLLLHELFRGERERTYALTYVVTLPDSSRLRGRAWICGCARPCFAEGSEEHVAVEGRATLLLRLAVMTAPH